MKVSQRENRVIIELNDEFEFLSLKGGCSKLLNDRSRFAIGSNHFRNFPDDREPLHFIQHLCKALSEINSLYLPLNAPQKAAGKIEQSKEKTQEFLEELEALCKEYNLRTHRHNKNFTVYAYDEGKSIHINLFDAEALVFENYLKKINYL